MPARNPTRKPIAEIGLLYRFTSLDNGEIKAHDFMNGRLLDNDVGIYQRHDYEGHHYLLLHVTYEDTYAAALEDKRSWIPMEIITSKPIGAPTHFELSRSEWKALEMGQILRGERNEALAQELGIKPKPKISRVLKKAASEVVPMRTAHGGE